jgi:hypothetical protein
MVSLKENQKLIAQRGVPYGRIDSPDQYNEKRGTNTVSKSVEVLNQVCPG